ncbi:hypothetical protein R1flu_028070 [Riccia fluitans]|uniref:Uncharacterized protein n=1 Tax=Riccia fluitans TaxID=41844 RepID=A0ABD1XKM4_9MARC
MPFEGRSGLLWQETSTLVFGDDKSCLFMRHTSGDQELLIGSDYEKLPAIPRVCIEVNLKQKIPCGTDVSSA